MPITDNFAVPAEETRERDTYYQLLKSQLPATKLHTFTASDTVDETVLCRGFHCNVGGNIKCLLADDSTARTLAVSAGAFYPYRIKRLYSTDTTATIVGVI